MKAIFSYGCVYDGNVCGVETGKLTASVDGREYRIARDMDADNRPQSIVLLGKTWRDERVVRHLTPQEVADVDAVFDRGDGSLTIDV